MSKTSKKNNSKPILINLKLITKKVISPLSKKIILEYNKLMNLLSKIPMKYWKIKKINGTYENASLRDALSRRLPPGTGGLVSISDIIAYQIGWGKRVIDWYMSGINDEEIVMPGDGFNKWDYMNIAKHFYKKYKYDS